MHLLAPRFFPLWDNAIAKHYHCGMNAKGYIKFMEIAKGQVQRLGGETPIKEATGLSALKALDEHNYRKYTKEAALSGH